MKRIKNRLDQNEYIVQLRLPCCWIELLLHTWYLTTNKFI